MIDVVADAAESNWSKASRAEVHCPHCGEVRQIERIGAIWFCAVCGKDWKAE